MTKKHPSLLVVCHDAGGSEVVSSWVKAKGWQQTAFLLEGPAIPVFERKLGYEINNLERAILEESIGQYTFVLTGTSWASDLEKIAHRRCKESGVPCAAYLDHWMEYRQRFIKNEQVILPSEIWVGDDWAYTIARKEFQEIDIKLEPNLYMEGIISEINSLSSTIPRNYHGVRVLYCTEPTSEVARKKTGNPDAYGYTEFSALENFISIVKKWQPPVSELRVRKHPSESDEKYSDLITQLHPGFPMSSTNGTPLAADCAWADIIVGCDSMVMAIGVIAGKKVFSCIPQGGQPLSIPMPQIVRMFNS